MAFTVRSAFFAIGFLTLGSAAGVTASAVAGRDGPRHTPGPLKVAQLIGDLDLTTEQQEALSAMVHETRTRRTSARGTRGGALRDVRRAIASGAPVDRGALHGHIDAHAALRTKQNHAFVDELLDLYESLDADQKSELSRMVSEHSSQRKKRPTGRIPQRAADEAP